MNDILIQPTEAATTVAASLADLVAARVRPVAAAASAAEFLRELAEPDVLLGVAALDGGGWSIVEGSAKPIVLVPHSLRLGADVIKRVLVPLDGTEEAAHAVAESVCLFRAAGTEIVVLHVFDRSTVPACWDQPAHARSAWEAEFLARHCVPYFDGPPPQVTLRSGHPGEHVVQVAEDAADLIILGWSRRLLPGRAQTVRTAVTGARVPVMLVPTVAPAQRDSRATRQGAPV
ncbi:universal stress protein [Nocardia crassostreae]|uniref:universal stress protein n=1 Tax=Nocardia crassostreae TaxID=53428 RepID=UPI00082C1808|nr:universal stress protein [Nocardia crassostreae]